jgi:hypothetical protein
MYSKIHYTYVACCLEDKDPQQIKNLLCVALACWVISLSVFSDFTSVSHSPSVTSHQCSKSLDQLAWKASLHPSTSHTLCVTLLQVCTSLLFCLFLSFFQSLFFLPLFPFSLMQSIFPRLTHSVSRYSSVIASTGYEPKRCIKLSTTNTEKIETNKNWKDLILQIINFFLPC